MAGLDPEQPVEVMDVDRNLIARPNHGWRTHRVKQHLRVRRANGDVHSGQQARGGPRDEFEPVLTSSLQSEPMPVEFVRRSVKHTLEFQNSDRILQLEATSE